MNGKTRPMTKFAQGSRQGHEERAPTANRGCAGGTHHSLNHLSFARSPSKAGRQGTRPTSLQQQGAKMEIVFILNNSIQFKFINNNLIIISDQRRSKKIWPTFLQLQWIPLTCTMITGSAVVRIKPLSQHAHDIRSASTQPYITI